MSDVTATPRPYPAPRTPREVAGFPRLAALRREAGLPAALCAARCGMSERSYRRFEAGGRAEGPHRDTFSLLLLLAPLLAVRLGRPVSAQWDLCGAARPSSRDHAGGVADPTGKSGAGESVRAGDATRRLHTTLQGG